MKVNDVVCIRGDPPPDFPEEFRDGAAGMFWVEEVLKTPAKCSCGRAGCTLFMVEEGPQSGHINPQAQLGRTRVHLHIPKDRSPHPADNAKWISIPGAYDQEFFSPLAI